MSLRRIYAPARLAVRCAGAFALVIFSLGCERSRQRASSAGAATDDHKIALSKDTIQLPPTAKSILVGVHTSTTDIEFSPSVVKAHTGDIVRFTAMDAAGHALGFDTDSLPPAQKEFLEHSQQLRSAPLISTGTVWIMGLQGAPPGKYPFHCLTHGGRGILVVS